MKEAIRNILLLVGSAVVATAIGSQLPRAISIIKDPFKSGDYSKHIEANQNKFTLYGTTSCQHCASARAFLKEFGVPFNDQLIDQSKEAAEKYKTLGEQGVPILVSKEKLLVGFNKKAYTELLHMANYK